MKNLDIECAITGIDKSLLISAGDATKLHTNFVSLDYFSGNGYTALDMLFKNNEQIIEHMKLDTYYCYYTSDMLNTKFFCSVPAYILTDDVRKYFDLFPKSHRVQCFRTMACDDDWNVPVWNTEKPNSVQKTLLGSGYYTSEFDGHSHVNPLAVKLSNGDHLVSFYNCFYHK